MVSVIIPCHNAARWLGEAVESALSQTYNPIEVIIVDDQSSDESVQIAQSFGSRIRLYQEKKTGGCHARNVGIRASKGKYIQFLDADDILCKRKIQAQVQILRNSAFQIVAGTWSYLHETKNGHYQKGSLQKAIFVDDSICSLLSDKSWVPNFCYLYKKQSLVKAQGWDARLSCMQDVDLTLRILMTGEKIMYSDDFCGYYRRPLQQTTSTRDPYEFMRQCLFNYIRAENYFNSVGWTKTRHDTLADCYFMAARFYSKRNRTLFEECVKKINDHNPSYLPPENKIKLIVRALGIKKSLNLEAFLYYVKSLFKKNTICGKR